MGDERSLSASREARDAGLDAVVEAAGTEFRDGVRGVVEKLPPGWTGTGEDIRELCSSRNISPHHHNAWGGVISGLIRKGFLQKTGDYTQMKSVKSHARETAVLERTLL